VNVIIAIIIVSSIIITIITIIVITAVIDTEYFSNALIFNLLKMFYYPCAPIGQWH